MGIKEKCWEAVYGKNEFIHRCEEEFQLTGGKRSFLRRIQEISFMYKNYCFLSTGSELSSPDYVRLIDDDYWKKEIDAHDIISFDIFDTLLLRPCFFARDLFYFLEYKNHIPNFRRMRIQAEQEARKVKGYEKVDIFDIYSILEAWCSIDTKDGAQNELLLEEKIDFVHPRVMRMFEYAKEKKKKIIITSDMYFPEKMIKELLKVKGIIGYMGIYVSCEYGVTKGSGELFELINKDYGKLKRLHIGDNKKADQLGAKKSGWDCILIENVNDSKERMRGSITQNWLGSVWAGIVDAYLYSGINAELTNPYFQYGFVYGGVLTYAFCQWIHSLSEKKSFDEILFLSRDCSVVEKVYNELFGNVENHYVQSSRISLLPYLCNSNVELFLQEAFESRIQSDKMSIGQAMMDIGLESLAEGCEKEFLELKNMGKDRWQSCRLVVANHLEDIRLIYRPKYIAFQKYIEICVGRRKRIGIIDVGWRGSSILYLKRYIEDNFEGVTVYGGMLAYANTTYTQTWSYSKDIESFIFSPDRADPFVLKNGKNLFYSNERLYLEYLFTDCGNSLLNYKKENNGSIGFEYEEKDVSSNNEMIAEIHRGILSFVEYYNDILGAYAKELIIGEKVAFEPLYRLLLKEKCLRKMFKTYSERKSTLHGYSQ